MNSKLSCRDAKKRLIMLDYDEPVPQDLQEHFDTCPSCRKEYTDQKEMHDLLRAYARACRASAPKELSDSVMKRIRDEKVEIKKDDTAKRLRLPIGTIAAAAAVLAVYVGVYQSKLPISLFSDEKANGTQSEDVNETQLFYAKSAGGDALFEPDVTEDSGDSYDAQDNTADSSSKNEDADYYIVDTDGLSDGTCDDAPFSLRQSVMKAPSAPDNTGSLSSGGETPQIDSAESAVNGSENTTYSAPVEPNAESTAYNFEADDRSLGGEEYSDGAQTDGITSGDSNGICGLPKAESEGEGASESESETVTEYGNGDGDENKRAGGGSSGGSGGGSSGGGASAGSNSGANANAIDFETLAERQFEKLSEQYPDRISRELFDSIGAEKYLAFLSSLEDFDADYNAERFAAFAAERSAG